MEFGIAGVAAITAICYLVGLIVKASPLKNELIPIACGIAGGALGVAAMYLPLADLPAQDPITAAAVGIVSGLAATGIDQAARQWKKGSDMNGTDRTTFDPQ